MFSSSIDHSYRNVVYGSTDTVNLVFVPSRTTSSPFPSGLPKELTENIRKLSEDEKKERGIVMLPENLSEALHMMMEDALVTETLGKEFADSYVRAKEEEWKEYLMQVSEWEIQKYLYLI